MRVFAFILACAMTATTGLPAWACVPVQVKESLLSDSAVANDIWLAVSPRDLASEGARWMESDPEFGPGKPARQRLLLALALSPLADRRSVADDEVIRVLIEYSEMDGPSVRPMLRMLERSSDAMRQASREKARQYWLHSERATASTALSTSGRLGGDVSREEMALLRAMVENPETANPAGWARANSRFFDSIRSSAAFALFSCSSDLDGEIEWASRLEGPARRAAHDGLFTQMLVEDGAFAQAPPDLKQRWFQLCDTLMRETPNLKANNYAMPIVVVMQRYPECVPQGCESLRFLRDVAQEPRLKEAITRMMDDACGDRQ